MSIELCRRGTDRVIYHSGTDGLLVHFIETRIRELQSFADLDLRGYNFTGADFRYGRFDGSDLRECVFAGADVRGASFRDADLRGCRWDHAFTDGADFTGAQR